MKDLRNTVLAAAATQLAGLDPYAWLLEVRVPSDPPTRIRVTNYSEPIARGTDNQGHPIVYYPFPVAQGDLLQQTNGNLTDVTFNIANITREFSQILDQYDGLAGQPVVIRLIHSQGITDPDSELRSDGTVVKCVVTDQIASFTVSAKNLIKTYFPKRRMLGQSCIFRFGQDECGYAIPASTGETVGTGFSSCGHGLADCSERGRDEVARGLDSGHPRRFGGFPGLVQGNR